MMYKLIMFLVGMLDTTKKKQLAIALLDEVLASRDDMIGAAEAEIIVSKVIQSVGNNITAFVVKA